MSNNRTVDDVIADVKEKGMGRTRYEGQRPFDDELLVAEIERLRAMEKKVLEATRRLGRFTEMHASETINPQGTPVSIVVDLVRMVRDAASAATPERAPTDDGGEAADSDRDMDHLISEAFSRWQEAALREVGVALDLPPVRRGLGYRQQQWDSQSILKKILRLREEVERLRATLTTIEDTIEAYSEPDPDDPTRQRNSEFNEYHRGYVLFRGAMLPDEWKRWREIVEQLEDVGDE